MPKEGDSIRERISKVQVPRLLQDILLNWEYHKAEKNDFMNEHEGKIYEEKNAKMFGCVMWIQRTKETQEKSFRETIQLLKMWQNV